DFEHEADARVWRIESSKSTIETHGLYCKDASGASHRLTHNEWPGNHAVTHDRQFVATTTRDGEFIAWRLDDAKEVAHVQMAKQYGYLQYDAKEDRFLWGDATGNGTSKLKS